jgi:hypothetical protein
LDEGESVVPYAHRGQSVAREPREEALVWQQRREHFDFPNRFGENFDGDFLVRRSD